MHRGPSCWPAVPSSLRSLRSGFRGLPVLERDWGLIWIGHTLGRTAVDCIGAIDDLCPRLALSHEGPEPLVAARARNDHDVIFDVPRIQMGGEVAIDNSHAEPAKVIPISLAGISWEERHEVLA